MPEEKLPPLTAAEQIALRLPWSVVPDAIAMQDRDGKLLLAQGGGGCVNEDTLELDNDQLAFILRACTTYHKRDRLLDAACDYLKRAAAGDDYAPTPHEMNEHALKIQAEQEGRDL